MKRQFVGLSKLGQTASSSALLDKPRKNSVIAADGIVQSILQLGLAQRRGDLLHDGAAKARLD